MVLTTLAAPHLQAQNYLKEGLAIITTGIGNIDSFPAIDVYTDTIWRTDEKIWFKDSLIIIEQKRFQNTFTNGEKELSEVVFCKYIFMDLKTLNSQNYGTFSDTATPSSNYKYKNIYIWNFFNEKNNSAQKLNPPFKILPDTVINNKVIKRVREDIDSPPSVKYSIYYADCTIKPNIFQLNPAIDDLLGGCKPYLNEWYYKDDRNKSIIMYRIEKEKLSLEEKRVFAAWEKNALTIKLPLLEGESAKKEFITCDDDKYLQKFKQDEE